MSITSTRKAGALATLALTLSLGLSACSDDTNAAGDEAGAASGGAPSSEPSSAPETSGSEATDASAQTFGPGCEAVPESGAGSFNGMATAPVASAASANPLLKTLVAAVGEAGLVDTLNSAEGLTVFAPTDEAFGKIPEDALQGVLADKELLTSILTHHVVAGQLGPDEVAGEHETLNGDTITVSGSGEQLTVGDENAAVLCGNIPTANATVYVVDAVLMP